MKHLKESGVTISTPPVAPRKAPPKNIEQVDTTFAPATDGQVSSLGSVGSGNSQDGEGMEF